MEEMQSERMAIFLVLYLLLKIRKALGVNRERRNIRKAYETIAEIAKGSSPKWDSLSLPQCLLAPRWCCG